MGRGIGLGMTLGGVGSGWTPAALAGLQAWSECDGDLYQDPGLTAPASVGDPVGGVPDRSGQGHTGAQATLAMKPTRVASAFPSGRGGLSFDGVDDRLVLASLGAVFSGNDVPFTVGVAFKVTDTAYRTVFGLGNSATGTPYAMLYSTATGTSLSHYRRDDASSSSSVAGPASTANQAQAVVVTFGEMPGVIARTAIDGISEASGALDVGATTLDRFVMGGVERAGSVLYPFKGIIGAWVVVARVIGAAERRALAAYLRRWMDG